VNGTRMPTVKPHTVFAIALVAILLALFAALFFAWLHSEWTRAKTTNRAASATNLVSFLRIEPQPRVIRKFSYNGRTHLEILGNAAAPGLSLPSSPPAYIFDQQGRLLDWASDPGDNPSFAAKWGGFSNATPMSVDELKNLIAAFEQ